MAHVMLISYTPEPEKTVAAAAKLCYSVQTVQGLLDGLTPEKTEKFIQMLMELGHESPVEHVSFTFAIEGVSRSLLAQITRHRIASYSVQSQRYVRLDPPQYVVPPAIADCPAALERYDQAMQQAAEAYAAITALLLDKQTRKLEAEGVDSDEAAKKAEKIALEDARFVLPNACETRMMVTMNARSLYHFFNQRCCTRAQWEIRGVADEMLRLVRQVAPVLFAHAGPPCVSGACPEGKMSCGQMAEMRAKYKGGAGL